MVFQGEDNNILLIGRDIGIVRSTIGKVFLQSIVINSIQMKLVTITILI